MRFIVVGVAPGDSGSPAFWQKLPQSEVAKVRSVTEAANQRR